VRQIVAVVLFCAGCRYGYLRSVIDTHVGFAPHLQRNCNMDTVAALRRHVTVKDIPILLRMLDSHDGVTQCAAVSVLACMQPEGRAALESEFAKVQEPWGARNVEKYENIREELRAPCP
jgi:hypothetical protein